MAFCGYLKQSTAVTLMLGPFVDEDDGKTAETGLTISQADVRLSKNGANMAQKGDATACTHDEIGIYTCPLSTTDTGTLGLLDVMVHESGALPVHQTYQVVTSNWYDTMCSTDQLDVNVTNVAGTAQTANDNGADINAILTDTAEIGAAGAGLTAVPWNAAWDAEVESEVDDALGGGTGTALTAIPWNADWDAEVQSEATDALNAYDPPTKAELDTGLAGLNDPTAAAIADAVWDETLSGHLGAGSTGEALNAAGAAGDPWSTAIPGAYGAGSAGYILGNNINAPLDVIDANVDLVLADTNELQTDDVPSLISGLNDPTAAAIADAVWDEDVVTAHNGANSAGSFIDDIAAILTDTGTTLDGKLDTIAGYLDTEIAAILADTDEIQAELANGGRLDLLIDDILADTNELQTDDIPALIAALNDLSAAEVNAEVVDALATDTYAEPGQGAPPATTTLALKIAYLYKFGRNKITQTSDTLSVFNDAGAVVDQKATISDDTTTYTRGEIGSGP